MKMNILESIALGIIQGLTEFLPVSSSGHLFLAEKWLGLTENLNLEILLHFGSLVAIIIYYWSEIKELLISAFSPLRKGARGISESREFIGKLLLATIITAPGAILIRKIWNPELTFQLVGITLIITAGIILIAEKFRNFFKSPLTKGDLGGFVEKSFNWKLAVWLGIVQSIAVLPGISRSGITVAFLILMGIDRKNSVKISFFLAIPTILGAMVLALKDGGTEYLISAQNFAGFFISIIVSLLSIKLMTKLVEKNWIWFAPYCAILGVALLFI